MLRRIIVSGGKGLTPSQLKEIETDVKDSQDRMLESHKDQREAVARTNKALSNELTKLDQEPALQSE